MIVLFSTAVHADDNDHSSLHHHLAAFVGLGFEEDKNEHYEDNIVVGVKYGLQFHEKWGVGLEVEKLYSEDNNRVWVVALPLKYYLNENWRLFLGPGYEFKGKKDKYLTRTGVAYEFKFNGSWSLSPEIVVDFISGGATVYVAGLAVGYGF